MSNPQALSFKTKLRPHPLGYGTFKIGRNEKIKYADHYELPTDQAAGALLESLFDLGIRYFDTAPAYGQAEARLAPFLARHRHEIILSTKVGEVFSQGQSTYDFSPDAIKKSLEHSLQIMGVDRVDCVFVHSDGRDLDIQQIPNLIETLQNFRTQHLTDAIGFSGKTAPGLRAALDWADAIMVEYHLDDPALADVITEAAARDVAGVVKKGLASGTLDSAAAIRFVLEHPGVDSLIIGSLSDKNMQANLTTAHQSRLT